MADCGGDRWKVGGVYCKVSRRCPMTITDIIKCLNLVLGYKGNGYKGYKWILAILKLRGLVKIKVKRQRKKG